MIVFDRFFDCLLLFFIVFIVAGPSWHPNGPGSARPDPGAGPGRADLTNGAPMGTNGALAGTNGALAGTNGPLTGTNGTLRGHERDTYGTLTVH